MGTMNMKTSALFSGVKRSVYSLAENKEGELWGGTQAGILFG